MNYLMTFVLGVFVGAAAALLLTPQSGEELRQRIRDEAVADRQKLQANFEKGKQEMQTRIHEMQGNDQGSVEQTQDAA